MNINIAVLLLIVLFVFRRNIANLGPSGYIALAAVILAYLYILIRYTPIIAEKVHLLEYGFLAYMAGRVFKDVRRRGLQSFYIIILVVMVGWCDELIQGMLPNRVYDPRDILLNGLSGILGLGLLKLLGLLDHPSQLRKDQ